MIEAAFKLLGILTSLLAAPLPSQRLLSPALFAGLHVIGVPLDILDDVLLLDFPFKAT